SDREDAPVRPPDALGPAGRFHHPVHPVPGASPGPGGAPARPRRSGRRGLRGVGGSAGGAAAVRSVDRETDRGMNAPAHRPGRIQREREARAVRWIALSFLASAGASIGLTVVYAVGGQPQVEGALIGVALGGLAIGFVLWGKRLI